jgi:hypothetical protein
MKDDRIIFKEKSDFVWYKKELDLKAKYEHRHWNEPEKYPAMLLDSVWEDNPNGPYEYFHSFLYQQEITCPHCKKITVVWPEVK